MSETYPAISVKGGKVHRPAETTRDRMAWLRPMTTVCGRTVAPLNVYDTIEAATGGRPARMCSQCEKETP